MKHIYIYRYNILIQLLRYLGLESTEKISKLRSQEYIYIYKAMFTIHIYIYLCIKNFGNKYEYK